MLNNFVETILCFYSCMVYNINMSNTLRKILFVSFLAIQFVLYIHILFLNVFDQSKLCYLSIVICFLFSLANFSKKNDTFLIVCALMFTVIADTFLVLLHATNLVIAMVSFCIVQLFYFVRILLKSDKKRNITNVAVRILLFVALLIVSFVSNAENSSFLIVISLFYFANLICNVIFAFISKTKNILFAFGLLLFLFCDIFVGLPFLIEFLNLPTTSFLYHLNNINFNIVWLFYLPSQVLIAISTKKTRTK